MKNYALFLRHSQSLLTRIHDIDWIGNNFRSMHAVNPNANGEKWKINIEKRSIFYFYFSRLISIGPQLFVVRFGRSNGQSHIRTILMISRIFSFFPIHSLNPFGLSLRVKRVDWMKWQPLELEIQLKLKPIAEVITKSWFELEANVRLKSRREERKKAQSEWRQSSRNSAKKSSSTFNLIIGNENSGKNSSSFVTGEGEE